jgi:hypothetical protein
MAEPAQTFNYMIAGYTVIFGAMAGYIFSLVLRFRSLQRERHLLAQLDKDENDRAE